MNEGGGRSGALDQGLRDASAGAIDDCISSLETSGCASLIVSDTQAAAHARGFSTAAAGLDLARNGNHALLIRPEADSAGASGLHAAGALSQYNVCREGIVFSNGVIFDLDSEGHFAAEMAAFFDTTHRLCRDILSALERRLQLPADWFERTLGPIAQSSQWHIKRYVPDAAPPQAVTGDGKQVRAGFHCSPLSGRQAAAACKLFR